MGIFDGDEAVLPQNMDKVNFRWKDLPIDEHPAVIFLNSLPRPGLISGVAYSDGLTVTGFQTHVLRLPPPPLSGQQHMIAQPINPDAFARMMIKIAHGMAIAEIGEAAFKPILPDFILKKRLDWSNVMGTTSFGRTKKDRLVVGSLHQENRYLIARIQLFAQFGFKPYEVIVGEMPGFAGYSYQFAA